MSLSAEHVQRQHQTREGTKAHSSPHPNPAHTTSRHSGSLLFGTLSPEGRKPKRRWCEPPSSPRSGAPTHSSCPDRVTVSPAPNAPRSAVKAPGQVPPKQPKHSVPKRPTTPAIRAATNNDNSPKSAGMRQDCREAAKHIKTAELAQQHQYQHGGRMQLTTHQTTGMGPHSAKVPRSQHHKTAALPVKHTDRPKPEGPTPAWLTNPRTTPPKYHE